MSDIAELIKLLRSRHSCVVINTFEEAEALTMAREACIEAQQNMWLWSSSRGLRDGCLEDTASIADTEHPAAALTYVLGQPGRLVLVMLDVAESLKDAKTLRLLRDAIDQFSRSGGTIVLIDSSEGMPACISEVATTYEIPLPTEEELEKILRATLREENVDGAISINIGPKELTTYIRNLKGLTARQARRIILDSISDDHALDLDDINAALAAKRRHFQNIGLLEYVEAPIDLSAIGGLNNLKAWLHRRQTAMTRDAASFGISPPRGILMLGVQGAGKSLSAKAVATAWGRPLMKLDPSTLYDRYVGESERRLRDALRQAEMMAPIILWIDEIEKGFASAASQSTDGGLSQRMFGTLLTWLQEHKAPVFTIATANNIDALPPELLRKGRFDEIFFVDLPTLEARAQILNIHLAKRRRNPKQFDIASLATASGGYSGAEIEQAIISALYDAFAAKEELKTAHILSSLQTSVPLSVTMAERVEALRAWAANRCVPAD